jgi:hypothetical protein
MIIVIPGVLVGPIASLILGVEPKAHDPVIGPYVAAWSFTWIMAFLNMIYVQVKFHFTRFTRALCGVCFAAICQFFATLWIEHW